MKLSTFQLFYAFLVIFVSTYFCAKPEFLTNYEVLNSSSSVQTLTENQLNFFVNFLKTMISSCFDGSKLLRETSESNPEKTPEKTPVILEHDIESNSFPEEYLKIFNDLTERKEKKSLKMCSDDDSDSDDEIQKGWVWTWKWIWT